MWAPVATLDSVTVGVAGAVGDTVAVVSPLVCCTKSMVSIQWELTLNLVVEIFPLHATGLDSTKR